MFDILLNDPNFLPITIIFIVLVVVAIWQKLDRYIIPLAFVFVFYALFTMMAETDEITQENLINENKTAIYDTSKNLDEVHIQESIPFDTTVVLKDEPTIIEKQVEEIINNPPDLRVNSILMCENIIDTLRKPINRGKIFPLSLKRIFCYTGIRNALSERTIKYEWYFQGNHIDTIPIKIGRSVHWRSWTYKTITDDQIGEWFVIIRDEITNTALDTAYFTIVDE